MYFFDEGSMTFCEKDAEKKWVSGRTWSTEVSIMALLLALPPPPAPGPSATSSLRTCFVPHHHRRVFGQHINANIVRCRPSTNDFLPTRTALKLKLRLLGAILAGNSIFTDPTHLSDKWYHYSYVLFLNLNPTCLVIHERFMEYIRIAIIKDS